MPKAPSWKRPKVLGQTGRGQPYLWLRPGRIGTDGIERGAHWIIKHASRKPVSTGCGPDESAIALEKLNAYRLSLYRTETVKGLGASQVIIADVLSRYLDHRLGSGDDGKELNARQREVASRVATLLEWWGERTLGDVDTSSCNAYIASRTGKPWKVHSTKVETAEGEKPKRKRLKPSAQRLTTNATARSDLDILRSAINQTIRDGYCREEVRVTLPDPNEPRDRWLTRAEAAAMVRRAWRKKEVQKGHVTDKHPSRHLVKYLLVGLRTGTRSSAICSASFEKEIGRPWVELYEVDGRPAARYHRKAVGAKEARNKRYPTVPLPDGLAAWMHRWHFVDGCRYVVEYQGKPIKSVRTAYGNLAYELGLGDKVVGHTLRHTAATWGMQDGLDVWQLSGYLGMTPEVLQRRYGHHSPDHMEAARKGMGGGNRRSKNAA